MLTPEVVKALGRACVDIDEHATKNTIVTVPKNFREIVEKAALTAAKSAPPGAAATAARDAAHRAVAEAVAKISGSPSPRALSRPTLAAKTDAGMPLDKLNSAQQAIISAARSITLAPSHIPSEEEIRTAHGRPGPMDELARVKAVMIASRGKAKR